MPGIGDSIFVDFDEEGFLNISFPREEEPGEPDDLEESIAGDNPFFESDLPLAQLADHPDSESDPQGDSAS